jgi:hypothetical protein
MVAYIHSIYLYIYIHIYIYIYIIKAYPVSVWTCEPNGLASPNFRATVRLTLTLYSLAFIFVILIIFTKLYII